MLIGNVHPSTIEGIKSLAAQYRKQRGVKHCAALDLAAKAANCDNFKHALRTLPSRGTTQERPYVMLTIYWHDKESHNIGRETLTIALKNEIFEICSKSDLKIVRGFSRLRIVAPDHFVCDDVAHSQEYARERLMTAQRSLRFMEYTGLYPNRDPHKTLRIDRAAGKLPNRDHPTEWIDPMTGQFIIVDEPYGGASDDAKRTAWAERAGWLVVKTSWPGMYRPYECDLYVVTDARAGYDIGALVAKINSMPTPPVEGSWHGESSHSWETFTSPMAKTPQDTRRARCRGTIYPSASKTTLPYSYNMGNDRRRPAAAMAVQRHIEAGSLLKAILRSAHCPSGAIQRLNSVRSTLEDWLGIEIGQSQLNGPEFFDIYYNKLREDDPNLERTKSHAGIVAMMGDLKQILQTAYPDCAPLRQQLHKIEMSLAIIYKSKRTDD